MVVCKCYYIYGEQNLTVAILCSAGTLSFLLIVNVFRCLWVDYVGWVVLRVVFELG